MSRFSRSVATVGAAALFGFVTMGSALAEKATQPQHAASSATEQKTASAKSVHKSTHEYHHKRAAPNGHVKAIQEALIKDGAKIKADGMMGRHTRAALKSFQKKNGLKVTGRADKATLKKLGLTG